MSEKRTVSIIVAVCNQLAYTKLALRSIMEQTELPFKLIIVDNRSRPEVREYFEALDIQPALRYIRNEHNLGPIVAINQGIKESSTPYICAIHNDVIVFQKGWLGKMVRVIEEDPQIGLIGLAGRKEIYKNGCVNEATLKHNLQNEDLNDPMVEEVSEVAVIDGMCIFLKRELLRFINGLDERYGYMHCYDLDISLQSIEAGFKNAVVKIEAMHVGNGGITRKTGAYRRMVRDDYGLLKKNCKVFARKWAHLLPLDIDKYRNSRLTKAII